MIQQAIKTESKVTQIIKRNMYKWHKIIGLITIIPVIFWTFSGLMHPLMSHWLKPKIAKEFIAPMPINEKNLVLGVADVLSLNKIMEFKNFRIVSFDNQNDNQTYYQVKMTNDELFYFDTKSGKKLENGDKIYAAYMARELSGDKKSKIKNITLITSFGEHYPYVNRLLPVWKVDFERPDGLNIYVETAQTRMATFNTHTKETFITIFDIFHNFSFIEAISNNTIRITIMVLLLSIICISTLSGLLIYGFMWNKFKKPANSDDKIGFLRKYHRQIGLAVSFVTLTFAFSGGYHATKKLETDNRLKYIYEPVFETSLLQNASIFPLNLSTEKSENKIKNLPKSALESNLTNISLVKMMEGKNPLFLWQLFYQNPETKKISIEYANITTNEVLKDANIAYSKFLAHKFALMRAEDPACCEHMAQGNDAIADASILKTDWITKFEKRGEYGFVQKRLPVMSVAFDTPEKMTYYVEPATGRFSTQIQDSDRREGFSFGFLHKYSFLEFAGKNFRDAFSAFCAFGVLVVSLFGLVLFLKMK